VAERPSARTSVALARVQAGARSRRVTIEYVVGTDAGAGAVSVVLTLHDVRGRIVRTLKNRRAAPGAGRVSWDGTDAFGARVEPGMYYARLRAGGVVRLSSVWLP
jgi:flagellar hook assembly protein FlgD